MQQGIQLPEMHTFPRFCGLRERRGALRVRTAAQHSDAALPSPRLLRAALSFALRGLRSQGFCQVLPGQVWSARGARSVPCQLRLMVKGRSFSSHPQPELSHLEHATTSIQGMGKTKVRSAAL